ncbi:MAG: leucine-rich repeat domain-containing protein, partial [Clostridiales bacterium]|nr:leucine-rich repeat domain-containing protein [Clostridiales bacterium]
LTSITIPDGVTSIGSYAFYGCTGLTSITIPESVTLIDEWAFYNCTNLADVYYEGSKLTWTAISIRSFNTYLTSATIHYGRDAESGTCGDGLIWVLRVSDGKLTISGTGDMTDWSSYSSVPWYSYRTSIASVTIENGVTSIGKWAFYNYSSLTSVTISDGVTSIGRSAFEGCTSLTSITIPGSVTSIDEYAFSDCTSLTSVTIADGVTSIGFCAFYNCTSLTSITIPDSVTSIDVWAFWNCTSLTSATIGSGVISIGAGAFRSCTSLASVTIPDSVTSIGSSAFYDCTSLTDVYYAGSEADWAAISIGDNNEALTSATIHYAETTITELTAPTITSLYNATNGVSVGWDAVDGAAEYIVWRLNNSTGKWEKCATTTGTTYLSTSPVSGTTYYYAIEAVNGDVTSGRGT